MTQDSNPDTDPNTTPSESSGKPPQSSEPQTVEAKVVPETSATPKTPKQSPATPKVSQPKATQASETNDAMEQAKAVGAELWRQAKPVLQKVGTQALILGNRATDFLLDKAFPTAKEKVIQILPADVKTQAQEKIDPVKAKVVPIWQKVWPSIKKTVGPLWAKMIAFIRKKLPQDLSGQLSDRFLNILVVTAFYLVWSFFSGLTHPSQAKQPASDLTFPEVKNKPSLTAKEKPKPRPTTSPSVAPKVAESPAPKPVTPPKVVTPPKPAPAPVKPVTPVVPPAPKPPVASPPKVEPPKVEPPKPIPTKPVTPPAPTPKPSETVKKPEPITPKPIEKQPVETPIAPKAPVAPIKPIKPVQSGPDLAALKADLVDAADHVVEDAAAMIKTVSIKDKQLKVALGDRWYGLSAKDQAKLAEDLYSKSKKLSYERLDIRDAKDERIARSPYIGDNMIILKRASSSKQTSITPSSN